MMLQEENDKPWILGVNASHSGSVCLLHGNEVVAAIQEERLSGLKRARIHASKPCEAIPYCLHSAGISAADLDVVALSTTGRLASSLLADITLNPQLRIVKNRIKTVFVPHHLAHASTAFAQSGFEVSAVLVIDGTGSHFEDLLEDERSSLIQGSDQGWEFMSIYRASGQSLKSAAKYVTVTGDWLTERDDGGMPLFNSVGGMYSAVAKQIFGHPLEAGKVMGLAPFGLPIYPEHAFYRISDNQILFSDEVPMLFHGSERWPKRQQDYVNLAASVQKALEKVVLWACSEAQTITGAKNLCFAGGTALNCPANELLAKSKLFEQIFIPPAADDSGVCIGVAYQGLWSLKTERARIAISDDSFGPPQNFSVLSKVSADFPIPLHLEQADTAEELAEMAADCLSKGEVLGWVQGRSELGPRALGHRSILANPRDPDVKRRLNEEIKGRESFRPFAPCILEDVVSQWYEKDDGTKSPFMLHSWNVQSSRRQIIPAVVHVDGTSRVQTVPRDLTNPLSLLLQAFERRTAIPILLNTSFNGSNAPMVESIEDALWAFVELELDCLVVDRGLIRKGDLISSIWDLVPVINARAIYQRMDFRQSLGPHPLELSIHLGERFPETHILAGPVASTISEIDGSKTMRSIWETLNAVAPLSQLVFRRELSTLRRLGVIGFGGE